MVLVALLLAVAPAALVATTERVCWDVYAEWGLTMRIFPDEPNGPSEVPIISSACDAASFSGVGAALATYATVGALATTLIVARRRARPSGNQVWSDSGDNPCASKGAPAAR